MVQVATFFYTFTIVLLNVPNCQQGTRYLSPYPLCSPIILTIAESEASSITLSSDKLYKN
ncbi:MAG: hypothetical protein VR72_01835 [Clostridiaceae bacterium BRH_c20a]|nr:MAG: hypothetical protein VR72_01835 [Clostridiaceae bacterium BRH_c20a]